jgi:hypothetical protein
MGNAVYSVGTGVKSDNYIRDDARFYSCPRCGHDHPSTTTCLDVIGSKILQGWYQKQGTTKAIFFKNIVERYMEPDLFLKSQQEAESEWGKKETTMFWKSGTQHSKDAADYGTQAHAAVEMFLTGWTVDRNALPEPSRNAFDEFTRFASENKLETIATEKTFYNCQMGYAGTADWVGKLNGKLSLADWKSSTAIWEKNPIQAWANGIAGEMCGDELYEQIVIGRFGRDGSTDILIVPRRGLDDTGFAGYEHARILIQACVPWFHYKRGWEHRFPYKRKEVRK